jgi:hypothetical protein
MKGVVHGTKLFDGRCRIGTVGLGIVHTRRKAKLPDEKCQEDTSAIGPEEFFDEVGDGGLFDDLLIS